MASKTVDQLMFRARGRQGSLLAFLTEILQIPGHVGCLMSWVDRSWRGVDPGDMEAPFSRSRPGGALEVAQRFEGGCPRSCHDDGLDWTRIG